MALEDIEKPAIDELEPQVEVYVEELLKKQAILVNQDCKKESIQIKKGLFADFHKLHQRRYMMSKMSWDGKEGRLFFLNSIELSVIVSSLMMGHPANTIEEKVKGLDFDDELKEAYGEVSNQLWGGINQLLVAKIDKDIHLSLDHTGELAEDGSQNAELVDEYNYLYVIIQVKVGEFDAFPLVLFISSNLVQDIYGVDIGGAAGGGGGGDGELNLAAGFDKVTVDKVMIADYPTIDVTKTIGDSFDIMDDKGIEAMPVIQDGKVVKVITKNNVEIIRSVFFDVPGMEERESRLMCLSLSEANKNQKLASVTAEQTLKDAAQVMIQNKIQQVPVVDENSAFLGMVTSREVLRLLVGEEE